MVVFAAVLPATGQRLFDRYDRICDENEQARLDFFDIELRKELPGARAFIVVYGGRCYSNCMIDYPRHRPQFPRKAAEKAWGKSDKELPRRDSRDGSGSSCLA